MSIPRIALLALLASAAHLAPAAADPNPPSAPWIGSGEGRRFYDVAVDATNLGCPLDDTAAKRAQVAKYMAATATIVDAHVRETFTKHAHDLQAWFDANVAGVPGTGTWVQINKVFHDADAGLKALPGEANAENVAAAPQAYLAVAAMSPEIDRVWTGVDQSPCKDRPGSWGTLSLSVSRLKDAVNSEVDRIIRTATDDYTTWSGTRPDATVPTTYWEHVAYVAKWVDYLAAAEVLAPKIELLARWGATNADAAKTAQDAQAALAAARAEAPHIAAELGNIQMPPLPKDAKRGKMLAAAVAELDGQMLGAEVGPKGTSVEKWTEEVEVRRDEDKIWYRNVRFVREHFTTYYGWKPKASSVRVPGVAADDLCEIWAQNFSRYTAGKPDKAWFAADNWREGYVRCSNTDKTSKLKVK